MNNAFLKDVLSSDPGSVLSKTGATVESLFQLIKYRCYRSTEADTMGWQVSDVPLKRFNIL